MISTDENALICDLAETYHIYDYRSLPCKKVGIFACGLRNNSRIMMKISESPLTIEQTLLALIADNTRMAAWLQTSDAMTGRNRPSSLLAKLLNEVDEDDIVKFSSGQEFDDEWRRLTQGGE